MSKKNFRIALGIEYEGTAYRGFQKQKTTKRTIQGLLDSALSKVADQNISTTCSGRTDAGVHAYCQIVHFDTSSIRKNYNWINGCNALLPPDIRVLWAKKVPKDFHARFSAISRTYQYIIRNKVTPAALNRNQNLWVKEKIDLRCMRIAASHLTGEHNFTSFRSTSCQSKTAFRDIESIRIRKARDLILIEITANAFLLNMVRIIVGTLLQVGLKKIPPKKVKEILEAKDRKLAGKTSSPKGLHFIGTKYLKKYSIPSTSNTLS
tara:strand:+ start:13706 stop:14497 length:792 start_codon:yes stop_codon:yes gene_type:complete